MPADEGNEDALIYNLFHLLKDGPDFECYNYLPQQEEENIVVLRVWKTTR